MNKSDVLHWVSGFAAAREAERRLIRQTIWDPNRSIRLALSLISLCRKQGGEEHPHHQQIRQEQERLVRERWRALRTAWDR